MLFLKRGHGLPTSFKKMSILALNSDPRENRWNKILNVHYMSEMTSSLHSLETSQPSQSGFSSHFYPHSPHTHRPWDHNGGQTAPPLPFFISLCLPYSRLFFLGSTFLRQGQCLTFLCSHWRFTQGTVLTLDWNPDSPTA